MNTPKPALVSERAAQRMPRWALLLFCGAYVLPGVFGRDPWKNADVIAVGFMMSIAQGTSSPWAPALAGIPADGSLLPYWIGAAAIKLLSPWVDPTLAVRLPFALLMVGVLALLWHATYHLARTEAAQPVPFAFGGEAHPVDYARAIADGAVLALIASLGLLQLGHETTPELTQLAGVAGFLYALAASPYRVWQARVAVLCALPVLAASGGPTLAILLGVAGMVICLRSSYEQVRSFSWTVLIATLLAAAVATAAGAWVWRVQAPVSLLQLPRLLLWFLWPVWLMAAWTLWRWRGYVFNRHISVPLVSSLIALAACAAMGNLDRALMLGLPGLAVLSAFALPTFKRSMGAAVDWFAVFFFTGWAIAFWVVYLSMHTGVPARPAMNVARLLPGFEPRFSAIALVFALLATLAWIGLVVWRTGRHRHPLWKSLVLPAGGVALNWLLALTLLLPPLDYARSYRPLVQRIERIVPASECLILAGLTNGQVAALEVFGPWAVHARDTDALACRYRLEPTEKGSLQATPRTGWQAVAVEKRPSDKEEALAVYRRAAD